MPIPLNCVLQSASYSPQLSVLPRNFLDIHIIKPHLDPTGFPTGSDSKESACNERDLGSVFGLGRSPGEGHSNQLQYSFLENSMHRGARRHKQSDTTE